VRLLRLKAQSSCSITQNPDLCCTWLARVKGCWFSWCKEQSCCIHISRPCREISRRGSVCHLGSLFFNSLISILEIIFSHIFFFSRTLNKPWFTGSCFHLPASWTLLHIRPAAVARGRQSKCLLRCVARSRRRPPTELQPQVFGTAACPLPAGGLRGSPQEATSRRSSCWQLMRSRVVSPQLNADPEPARATLAQKLELQDGCWVNFC